MDKETTKILKNLEHLPEKELYENFVKLLQEAEGAGPTRVAVAPLEWITWAHQQTQNDEFRIKISRCAEHLLDAILTKDPKDVNPAETYHLGILLTRLQLRHLSSKLRRLVERECMQGLYYRGIDLRLQLLYHLESLGHLDVPFWENEIRKQRFAAPAFLALSRIGQKHALRYLPFLVEASLEYDIPLANIFQLLLERQGMEGYPEKVLDLFSDWQSLPKWVEFPAFFQDIAVVRKEERWRKYEKYVKAAFKGIGINANAIENTNIKQQKLVAITDANEAVPIQSDTFRKKRITQENVGITIYKMYITYRYN